MSGRRGERIARLERFGNCIEGNYERRRGRRELLADLDSVARISDECDVTGLQALGALGGVELDLLVLF